MAQREVDISRIPRVPYDAFLEQFLETWGFPNGSPDAEHLTVLGETGSGKTTMLMALCGARAEARDTHVVVFSTKPASPTMSRWARRLNWKIISTWPPGYGQDQVILWPKTKERAKFRALQRARFSEALEEMWVADSNRLVVFDEEAYLEDELRLRETLDDYWTQGRELGITIAAGTQRPRNVLRPMLSEPSWVVAFRITDLDDRKRLGEIGGDRKLIFAAVDSLAPYECFVMRKRTREYVITKLPRG